MSAQKNAPGVDKHIPAYGCSSLKGYVYTEISALAWKTGRLFLFAVAGDKCEHRDTRCDGIDKYPDKSEKLIRGDIHSYHFLTESSGRKQ